MSKENDLKCAKCGGTGRLYSKFDGCGLDCDCKRKLAKAPRPQDSSGSTEFTGCMEKPPLGLRPWRIAREMRAKEITDAMQRYWEAEKLVPKEWFDELKHLVG